jgi:hypothetical protein
MSNQNTQKKVKLKSVIVGVFVLVVFVVVIYIFIKPKTDSPQTAQALAKQDSFDSAETLSKTYSNETYGFSLPVPNDIKQTDLDDDNGETTLLQSPDYEMQIKISAFDEDISLNLARIKKDIPDMQLENPQEIKTDSTASVTFISGEGNQKNREIWFVHGGYLYQILSPAVHDSITEEMMAKWKWN